MAREQTEEIPARLTPERLFSDPPLTGGSPVDLKFAPDGSYLTYRRAADDDRERMDLWKIDPATGNHTLLLDARTLSDTGTDVTGLTAEERAERERRRQFNHGITQYRWHPDGQRLLIPMDGRALLVTPGVDSSEAAQLQWIGPHGTRQSGFQLSGRGRYLSYVRAGDLYFTDLQSGAELRVTDDASEVVSNGLPDFLAAEEMHRFEGHWWAGDDSSIAFTKVDESCVRVSHRLEVDADGAKTVEQRYPYAGETNPRVELWRYDLATDCAMCVWRPGEDEEYLARVHMGNTDILIQTQDRRQRQLTLRQWNATATQWQNRYEESSQTWINLTDDLRVLGDGRILLSSERSGTRRALLLGADSAPRELPGPVHFNSIVAHNDSTVWVCGWDDSPMENHLFAIQLDGSGYTRITREAGCHDVVVDLNSGQYLDYFSSERTPPRLHLCRLDEGREEVRIYAESFDHGHPYAPFFPAHSYASFGEVAAEDGQHLCYRLTPPAQIEGTHPVIVYVYGGPGPQKSRREWSPLLLQLFAHHGFGVLEVDNRGTGNRGATFEAPLYRRMGSIEVIDQVAGLQVLDDTDWADRSRVGIFGHSYGGYMTLMCLTQAAEHFAAGVAVAPVSDWTLYDTHYTERYMGLPAENQTGYEAGNVLTHLHKLEAPLLLMHGMADDNVLFTHSTLIMSRLQQLHKPFELMTYPGAKHSMQERDVSIHRFNMILDFFKRRLGSPR